MNCEFPNINYDSDIESALLCAINNTNEEAKNRNINDKKNVRQNNTNKDASCCDFCCIFLTQNNELFTTIIDIDNLININEIQIFAYEAVKNAFFYNHLIKKCIFL